MLESISLIQYALAVAWVAGGAVAGVVLRWVLGRLERRGGRGGRVDSLLFGALRRVALVAAALVGAWVGTLSLPLTSRATTIVGGVLSGFGILLVTLVISSLAGEAARGYAARVSRGSESTSLIVNITRLVILTVGLLVMLQTFGVSITPLLTALGVGGLAVALALQDTLSNLFGGVHILASRKVRAGDYVALDSGEEGYVVDINWRNTSIRQLPNNVVVVPNAKLSNSILTNFHQPERELSILVDIGVSYDSDLEAVETATIDVAREVMKEVPGGVPAHEPFLRYHTFDDYSVVFTVILRAAEFVDQYLVKHEFVKRLHRRYAAEGIVIPFPIQTLMAPDGRPPGSPVAASRT